ncbi:hypothetical protein [Paraconexibacter algicola]|nr:hypothetical protein [Paraconexibacter algicola]
MTLLPGGVAGAQAPPPTVEQVASMEHGRKQGENHQVELRLVPLSANSTLSPGGMFAFGHREPLVYRLPADGEPDAWERLGGVQLGVYKTLFPHRYGYALAELPGGKALIVGGRAVALAEQRESFTTVERCPDADPNPFISDFKCPLVDVALPGDSAGVAEPLDAGDPDGVAPRFAANAPLFFDGNDLQAIEPYVDGNGKTVNRFEGATATALADGRVLVVGGKVADVTQGGTMPTTAQTTATTKVEIYDPANEQWTPAAPLNTARAGHSATLLADGRVLVVGGAADTDKTTEIYTPADQPSEPGSWAAGTPSNVVNGTLSRAARLSDGRVMVVRKGGAEHSELYTPEPGAGGSWVRIAHFKPPFNSDNPAANTFPLFDAPPESVVALPGGKAFSFGNIFPKIYSETQATKDAQREDAARPDKTTFGGRIWTPTDLSPGKDFDAPYYQPPATENSPNPQPRVYGQGGNAGMAKLADGRIMVAGGKESDRPGPGKSLFQVSIAMLIKSADAPVATLTAPASGTTVGKDSTVASSFTCEAKGADLANPGGCTMKITPPTGGGPAVTISTSGDAVPTSFPGTYSMVVTALDEAGLEGTATGTYTVADKPTGTITAPSAGLVAARNATIAADFSCSYFAAPVPDSGTESCVAKVTSPLNVVTDIADGDNVPTDAIGTYTVTVTATDKIGQTATKTSTYLISSGPGVDITSPAVDAKLSVGASLTAEFACTASAKPLTSCVASLTVPGGQPVPITSGSPLPTDKVGTYQLVLSASDELGDTNSVSRSYEVLAPPTATIDHAPDGTKFATGTRLAAAFTCASPASTITSCAATITTPSGESGRLIAGRSLPMTVDGVYTVDLKATDAVGQTKSASAKYRVVAPPTVTIDSPVNRESQLRGESARLDGTPFKSGYSCTSDGSEITACAGTITAPSGTEAPIASGDQLPSDTLGDYKVVVSATDALGQTDSRTRTYTVSNCRKGFEFALVQVRTKGCFETVSGTPTRYETADEITVNGLTIPAPPSGSKTVFTAPSDDHPGGQLGIRTAELKVGTFTYFNGPIQWDLPEGGVGDEGTVATLQVPSGAAFQGLRVRGSIALTFGRKDDGKYYTSIPMQVALPSQFSANPGSGAEVTAAASIYVDAKGPRFDGTVLNVKNVWVGKLKVDEVCLSYVPAGASKAIAPCPAPDIGGEPYITCKSDPNTNRWNGNATITLPTESETQLAMFGGLADGQVSSLGGVVSKLGKSVPLAPNVYLDQIGVGLCLRPPPFKLKGSVGVSILPTGSKSTIGVDGSVTYTDGTASEPWSLEMRGNISVLDNRLGGGGVTIRPTGLFDFDAGLKLRFSILSVEGGVVGWVDVPSRTFNIDGKVRACVSSICAQALATLSSVGAAACLDLGVIKVPYPYPAPDWKWYAPWRIIIRYVETQLKGGGGLKWNGTVKAWVASCDMGDFQARRPGTRSFRAGTANTRMEVTIKPEEPTKVIQLSGVDGPPSVKVAGPDGTTITNPTDGSGGAQDPGKWLITENPDDKSTTIVLINPKAGRWTITKGDGPIAPLDLKTADYSPPPTFKAAVTSPKSLARKGQKRFSVAYTVDDGEKVQLVDESVDGKLQGTIVKELKGSSCGHGAPKTVLGSVLRCATVAFTPTEGPGGPRRVYAVVTRADGMPRSRDHVASYVAPLQRTPGMAQRLRIRRTPKGKGVVVTWSASRPAKWQTLSISLTSGEKFGARASKCTSLHIPWVAKSVGVNVRVAGVRSDMVTGKYSLVQLAPDKKSAGPSRGLRDRACRIQYVPRPVAPPLPGE